MLLEIKNLDVAFAVDGGAVVSAAKGVCLSLGRGEILGLVGESGSGKSTIAKTLIGLERASSGVVSVAAGASLQMIFQDAVGSLNPRMTVRQTLDEVIKIEGRRKKESASARAAADKEGTQYAVNPELGGLRNDRQ